MHKFTAFTIILSIVIISIVVEIVSNGYSLTQDYVPAAEMEEIVEVSELSKVDVSNEATPEVVEESTEVVAKKEAGAPEVEEEVEDIEIAVVEKEVITDALLTNIGIEQPQIKPATNKELFLQAIKLEESLKNGLKTVNLFDFEEFLGTIYALHFETADQALSVYSKLKAEAIASERVTIKETNTFGERSFYVNQEGKTKTAFAVVQVDSSVYGFEYPHKSHQLFKDLSTLLKQ